MIGREVFHFDEFTLDVAERRLLRRAEPVRLSPKAYDVLVALVRQAGRLVTKDELLARVWSESFVAEGILTVHVAALRKALGDDTRPPAYIETVARSGYRFIAAVTCDSADEKPFTSSAMTRPVELYELVGRGRSHLLSGSYFELPGAVDAFRAAIEIDSTYAPAHAGLARARCVQAAFRAVPHQEAFAEAKASALRALAMNSASADAQVALGTVLFLSEWDWAAAARSLRRALEINPDHTEALLQYGSLQEALGRLDEGLRSKQQALAHDPRSAGVLVQISISYWHQRKYDDTLVWARRALEVDPKQMLASEFIAHVYWKTGDVSSFAAHTIRQAIVFGVPDETLAVLKQVTAQMQQVYATAGLSEVNRFMVDQTTNQDLDFDAVLKMAFRRAILFGAAGRLDEAFDCLDQAIAYRDPALVHLAVAPEWDSLRGDPRFAERLRSMALPSIAHDNIGNV
ncbi:MAG: winged helix-turn-helix domain-containing protein [Acidobacteria bacterium]|nr:winged helix-turn-helix domain-containing protein [Acidobacteriota bacterium]